MLKQGFDDVQGLRRSFEAISREYDIDLTGVSSTSNESFENQKFDDNKNFN